MDVIKIFEYGYLKAACVPRIAGFLLDISTHCSNILTLQFHSM